MEKKVTKKFYYLSCLNLITILVLTWGNYLDALVMLAILIALVANHTLLVKIIGTLAASMSDQEKTGNPTTRILMLMFFKMMLLGVVLTIAYLYSAALLPKVMFMMIFQLIIQVVSIKNNY